MVGDEVVCERWWVTKLCVKDGGCERWCVTKVWVTKVAGGGGRGGGGGGIHNQKQELHTKM